MNLQQVSDYIAEQPRESPIYLGCDSQKFRLDQQWYADYVRAVVIHHNGNNGCKLFGDVIRERVWSSRGHNQSQRLMTEVYKVAELYLSLEAVLTNRPVQIHLDLNSDHRHASSAVIKEAIGYIQGTCQRVPMIKPHAFAATYAADRWKSLPVKSAAANID